MARYRAKQDIWEERRTVNGSRKSFYGKSEEEAVRLADIACGKIPKHAPDHGTIREFVRLNVWPRYAKRAIATQEQGRWALTRYILPAIGDLKCEDLQLHHCQDLLRIGKSGSTERTVRKHLFRITRLLARERKIPYNYLEEIEAPPVDRRKPILTIMQARQLWESCKDKPIGPAVFMAAFLGLRRGEALGISADDLGDTLLVRDQTVYQRKAGKVRKDKLKTASSSRTIGLPEAHKTILEGYSQGVRILCHGEDGTVLHPTSLRKMLLRECKRAGVPECSLHSLRATFMTGLEELGCPRAVLRAIVGHSAQDVTDGYIHVQPEVMARWIGGLWDHTSTWSGVLERGTASFLLRGTR